MGKRQNFTEKTRLEIARNAMYVCSRPECLRYTGYEAADGKPRAIAEAAHIDPASPNGPRAKTVSLPASAKVVGVKSADNGIWLCTNCHTEADGDPTAFPPHELMRWKIDHAKRMRGMLGKDLESSILALGASRVYHAQALELLTYTRDMRALFNDMAIEFPVEVKDSIYDYRTKLRILRGQLSPLASSTVVATCDKILEAVRKFLDAMAGRDFSSIPVTSGNADFEYFCEALFAFRKVVVNALAPLAEEENFSLPHLGS